MPKYKITMWSPLYTYVRAINKEEAISIAMDKDDWEAPIGQGFEDYEAELIKDKEVDNGSKREAE